MSVWREGTRTESGLAIGDAFERAPEHYHQLECDVRNQNSEYVEYRYCPGRIGSLWLWFGRDPIESITVSATPIG